MMSESGDRGPRTSCTASTPVILLILIVGVGGGFAAQYFLDGPYRAIGVFVAIILAFALAFLFRRPMSPTK